ncbi:rhodanese [Methylotenera oryzisoli]|jgi:rhodanese-related sulfurtransferase|uniref:Rhodanese n=1 Tax=Methylotenera oryzisoli TaxID=2080758 RepID=A0A4Y9VPB2_9PROT|nr:rhodanese-like domain-containing protein [Methylotenera oryzisoli]TFW70121.1 rhodanese [Methylotenera oryzisoli]
MSDIQEILALAEQRAIEKRLPYTGALTPQEADAILRADASAQLVDVRTKAELELVGRVPSALHVEWAFYPGMVANPDFAAQLQAQLNQKGADKNTVIMFLCRTGGRSHNAAVVAESLGYMHVYNVLEGFEGDANEYKQRTLINGWKHAGLPWTN